MEFSLLWAALTAVGASWAGLRWLAPDRHKGDLDRLISAAAVGLLVGRLAAMLSQGVNPLANPAEILVVRGGVSTVAATVAFVLTIVYSTRPGLAGVDRVASPALVGLAGWHAGCLWRGACLGSPSDLPWAWSLPGSEVTRHPVELYTALLLLAGAVIVARVPAGKGRAAGAALAVAAGARLLTEPLRPSLEGGPVLWYSGAVVVGVAVFAYLTARPRATCPREGDHLAN